MLLLAFRPIGITGFEKIIINTVVVKNGRDILCCGTNSER